MAMKTWVFALMVGSAHANTWGLLGCRCLNPVELGAVANVTGSRVLLKNQKDGVVEVNTDYGSKCDTWDQGDRWCYVDLCNCDQPDVKRSDDFNLIGGHYLKLGVSVRTCSQMTPTESAEEYLQKRCSQNQTECASDEACTYASGRCSPASKSAMIQAFGCKGRSGCPCINPSEFNCVASKEGTVTFNAAPTMACLVPSNYASACSAWDAMVGMHYSMKCSNSNPASWCSKAWCYVDRCNCDDPEMAPSTYFKVSGELNLGYSYRTCDSDGRSTSAYLRDVCNDAGAEGSAACADSSLCEILPSSNPNITNCTPISLEAIQTENTRQCPSAGGTPTKRCTTTPPKPDACRGGETETSAAGVSLARQDAAVLLIAAGGIAALA